MGLSLSWCSAKTLLAPPLAFATCPASPVTGQFGNELPTTEGFVPALSHPSCLADKV